jgi:hypothetical protein
MVWQDAKELFGIISGLLGVVVGAWLAPYVASLLENARLKKGLKPDLMKSIFSYYRVLREKVEIVNPLSMDERAATIITDELNRVC